MGPARPWRAPKSAPASVPDAVHLRHASLGLVTHAGKAAIWSSRTMARTGLRMMPTFPSSPLKFRTAGFPRYGFKASLSDGACLPRVAVKLAPSIPARHHSLRRPSSASATGTTWLSVQTCPCFCRPLCERPCLSTPGVLGSGAGYVVPLPHRLLRPHPPVSQARSDFTTLPLIRCAFAVRERRGDPRDLPYFRCGAVHACRRPYAGGARVPSRCCCAPRYQACSEN